MKQYIAVIGIYNEITTEQISLKEISVQAANMYDAHKQALFKCNSSEEQTVLRLLEATTKCVKFDLLKGFVG
jgi:hypothetical protein